MAPKPNKNKTTHTILWIILILFCVLSIIVAIDNEQTIRNPFSLIAIVLFAIFSFTHGIHTYGLKKIVVFFGITSVVSWSIESISIVASLPFGSYHYTDLLGPKLGPVPLIVMLVYFIVSYIAWTIAHILLDKFNLSLKKEGVVRIPIIASFIMVMWNLTFDPFMSTITNHWIWENGGAYFGVPFANFIGWFICAYITFQLFALYQQSQDNRYKKERTIIASKAHWLIPVLFYASLTIKPLIAAIVGNPEKISSLDNHTWWTQDIYTSLALIAIFTMIFVAVLAIIKLSLSKKMNKKMSENQI